MQQGVGAAGGISHVELSSGAQARSSLPSVAQAAGSNAFPRAHAAATCGLVFLLLCSGGDIPTALPIFKWPIGGIQCIHQSCATPTSVQLPGILTSPG